MFNTNSPGLGDVYEGIDSMIEKLRWSSMSRSMTRMKFFYKEVKDILTKRWNKMTTSLHLLAYAMNLKYYLQSC